MRWLTNAKRLLGASVVLVLGRVLILGLAALGALLLGDAELARKLSELLLNSLP